MLTAENSAKQGDDMVTTFLFTAKFSAKRGDNRLTVFLFTNEFLAKRGDDIGTFIYHCGMGVNTPLKLILVWVCY